MGKLKSGWMQRISYLGISGSGTTISSTSWSIDSVSPFISPTTYDRSWKWKQSLQMDVDGDVGVGNSTCILDKVVFVITSRLNCSVKLKYAYPSLALFESMISMRWMLEPVRNSASPNFSFRWFIKSVRV